MENYESKINKIREISNEVNELHPLIKDLFPRIPNIEKYSNKHGQNEMGDNFIVSWKDSINE